MTYDVPQSRHLLADLSAREEIRNTLNRLVRATDRIDRELLLSCYHPDAVEEHGHFQGSAVEFAEFICGPRSARFAGTTHLLGTPTISIDADVALADTPCVAHCVTVPDDEGVQRDFVSGVRYIDRVTLRSSAWLIERRVSLLDWTYTIPIEVGILEGLSPEYRGRRDLTDMSYDLVPRGAR